MTSKLKINTSDAPAAIGPYSQAIKVGTTLYMSGQIALDPETGEFVGTTVGEQTHQVLKNMTAVLEAAQMKVSDLVMVTIYLISMEDFGIVNAIYGEFVSDPAPARGTIAVKTLPKGALVEIVGIADKR